MIDELFRIGPISISPFGPMLVVAFLGAFAQLRWGLRRLDAGSDEDANAILIAAALGGILGGKIYYALLYQDVSLIWNRAGIVFFGSLIGGTLTAVWVIRRRGLRLWPVIDAGGLAVAIGYSLGRVGCLLVGDDYGRPTQLPWGMTFPNGPIPTTVADLQRNFDVELPVGLPPDQYVAVHPTQIYETVLALAIFLIGRRWLVRSARVDERVAGIVGLGVFALLMVERFAIEFLRAKDDRFFGPLTLAQVISLALLAVIAFLVVSLRRRSQGTAGQAAPGA